MEQMTAAQKLGRLKQIDAALHSRPTMEATMLLVRERAEILATVGLPPLDLIGCPWGEAWADAFGEAFPGFDRETLLVWFQNACASGAMKGVEEGKAMGVNKGLVDALVTIKAGFEAGKIRCQSVIAIDGTDDALFLGGFILRALEAAGNPDAGNPASVAPAGAA